MASGKRWSKDELNRIKSISELYSIEDLAEFFGRSEKAIKAVLCRYKLKHKYSRVSNKELETEDTKYCTGCESVLPLSSFHRQSGGRKGVYNICRACYSERRKHLRILASQSVSDDGAVKKQELREKFVTEHKDTVFYCEKCESDKTLDDYVISVKKEKNGSYRVAKECKQCKQKRNLARIRKKGY